MQSQVQDRSSKLREVIYLPCKANNVANINSVYLGLLFRTESELAKIAKALHINVNNL